MMKLIKNLRPPSETLPAPAGVESPAPSAASRIEPPLPPSPTWGTFSQRLLGHLSAVESGAGQPTMPNHGPGKTANQSH